jgi:hypothetical protein
VRRADERSARLPDCRARRRRDRRSRDRDSRPAARSPDRHDTIRIAETGAYDEKTGQFELKADYAFAGETWHQRTVIQPMSADAMIATSYLSVGNVPEWKGVEIKYTRRTK